MNLQEYIRPRKKSDNVQKKSHVVRDMVLLGDWEKIEKQSARTINPKLNDEILDGLIIKGYEMKWNKTNENGEQYDKTAFDEFIQQYFVDGKLNMPVDINHQGYYDWRNYCGRVLYIETNSVGFYFVVYVPKTYADYDRLLWGLENGIIQGFSKEGYVSWEDFDWVYNEDGTFDHEQIHKMRIVSVSLVTTPANGLPFEKMQQTQNALVFEKKTESGKSFADLFNK
jgi:phage head maturation protease